MKTGLAHLPLHRGKAPPWLFNRMKKLAREIVLVMLTDFDSCELLQRLANPFWFQALGCVLGFDWHSSGLTTTVCAALKEGLKGLEHEIDLFIAGGKGRSSRKTPSEILGHGKHLAFNPEALVYASRISAKVDSAALQDGYQLYHHVFFFNRAGQWSVVQQGLNAETRYARRYHWLYNPALDFICEPHKAICCNHHFTTLNLVAKEGARNQMASAELASEHPDRVIREVKKIPCLNLPARHQVLLDEINPDKLYRILLTIYENQPAHFEALLNIPGVGPKTLRSLALLSELLYGARASWRDPARFSYAHGGKDGHPYPVDRELYDDAICFLKEIVNAAKIENTEKKRAFRRLSVFSESSDSVRYRRNKS